MHFVDPHTHQLQLVGFPAEHTVKLTPTNAPWTLYTRSESRMENLQLVL